VESSFSGKEIQWRKLLVFLERQVFAPDETAA
jgi:hypothetical protein